MKSVKPLLRVIWKTVTKLCWLALAYTAIVLILNQYDETLDPEFTKFIEENRRPVVPDEENGYYAFMGFGAPEGQEIQKFGKQVISHYEQYNLEEEIDLDPLVKGAIEFKRGDFKPTCWGLYAPAATDSAEACNDKNSSLQRAIQDNGILLERLTSLYQYQYFVRTTREGALSGVISGQDFMSAQELLMAKLVQDAQNGKADSAIKTWLANAETMQRFSGGRTNTIEYAILGVAVNLVYKTYPLIAEHLTTQQLAHFQPQLNTLFNTQTHGKNWDVAGSLYEESQPLKLLNDEATRLNEEHTVHVNMIPAYLPNATNNLFIKMTKDFIHVASVSPQESIAALERFRVKYKTDMNTLIFSFLYNASGKFVVHGMSQGTGLIVANHERTARSRMFQLYTDARISGVTPEKMPDYLNNAPETLHNPFTEKPFEWDSATQSIVMPSIYEDDKGSEFRVKYSL